MPTASKRLRLKAIRLNPNLAKAVPTRKVDPGFLPGMRMYYGWRQDDVAKHMGVPRSKVSMFEQLVLDEVFAERYYQAILDMGHAPGSEWKPKNPGRFTRAQLLQMHADWAAGQSYYGIAKRLGVGAGVVHRIVNGERHRDVWEEFHRNDPTPATIDEDEDDE